MKTKDGMKLTTLLSQAERHLPVYLERTRGLAHESKGIRRSEMFFFYASVADSKPARIVESGRARAQSTLVLSRLFPQALIVSLESDATSPDAAVLPSDCAIAGMWDAASATRSSYCLS
jgi:predicted O-methyltransferase YrrM